MKLDQIELDELEGKGFLETRMKKGDIFVGYRGDNLLDDKDRLFIAHCLNLKPATDEGVPVTFRGEEYTFKHNSRIERDENKYIIDSIKNGVMIMTKKPSDSTIIYERGERNSPEGLMLFQINPKKNISKIKIGFVRSSLTISTNNFILNKFGTSVKNYRALSNNDQKYLDKLYRGRGLDDCDIEDDFNFYTKLMARIFHLCHDIPKTKEAQLIKSA